MVSFSKVCVVFVTLSGFLFVQSGFAMTVNDPLFADQWYLQKIQAPVVWDTTTGSQEVIVAILDTGVDLDHPDLKDNLWTNPQEIPNDGIDNDQNGYIDDMHGYDFVGDDADPQPDVSGTYEIDSVVHGTVVASILGAVGDNAEGMAGINHHVRLMSVRILDALGIGDSTSAIKAIDYAIANHAQVINLSFTGFDDDPRFMEALKRAYNAGIFVVAAIGNSDNGGTNVDLKPIYPACYGEEGDIDWIIGVGATDRLDRKSTFSNYGALCTDISAPGEEIMGAVFQTNASREFARDFYLSGWSGTSMSAPMVSGAAALLLSNFPDLTLKDLKSILRLSADPEFSEGDALGKTGAGRLNIAKAFEIAPSFVDHSLIASSSRPSSKPSFRIAIASEQGSSQVRLVTNAGAFLYSFQAYDEPVGVRLVMGDVNADGKEEIVTVPTSGLFPLKVFSLEGLELASFFPFGTYTHGMFVAVGDVDQDGFEEIAVSQDADAGEVALFTGKGERLQEFDPFETTGTTRVALADVDGDGKEEVITTRGNGFEPWVRVHTAQGVFIKEFLAYAKEYDKGVFVSGGDLDGNGTDEIVTGTDIGGGPQVQIYGGDGRWLGTFFAYAKDFRGGVRLSVGNLSDWPGASIIAAAGPGGGPQVRVFNGYSKLIGTFFSGDEADRNGINSTAWGL